MTREDLLKIMNNLCTGVKIETSADYRKGYVEGVLDYFNETEKKIKPSTKK